MKKIFLFVKPLIGFTLVLALLLDIVAELFYQPAVAPMNMFIARWLLTTFIGQISSFFLLTLLTTFSAASIGGIGIVFLAALQGWGEYYILSHFFSGNVLIDAIIFSLMLWLILTVLVGLKLDLYHSTRKTNEGSLQSTLDRIRRDGNNWYGDFRNRNPRGY